jgi:predicted MFS family arabinose efflux permease
VPDALARPAPDPGRDLFLLAAGMAALYAMVELVFGVASLTFEKVGGSDGLVGVAPAIFLACSALAALPAGRAMDRRGRRIVLGVGFAAGIAGCLLAFAGLRGDVLPATLLGFALTGVATGTVLLSRAAASELVPPERRPRAIGQVLFGAVFGALLGTLVFGPLLGDDADTSALELAWVGGAAFMLAGLIAVSRLRHDSRPASADSQPARSLRALTSSPALAAPLLAMFASWAGMVTAMSLTGSALIDHGHEHGAVFPVLGAHFVGMFGFFLVVGRIIERIGRPMAIAWGLALLAASCLTLALTIDAIHLAAVSLFGVGLGWSLSFVAATAELAEHVEPGERATVIGLADLVGAMTGAALVVAGGVALDELGFASVALGAAALPLLAALWVLRSRASVA